VYIADTHNHRIRKVTVSTGIIATIAGDGTSSYSGDNGQATSAALNSPYGVTLDSVGTHSSLLSHSTSFPHSSLSLGNVYIADNKNNRIRKVTISTGIITTIAGSSTSGGYSGDNSQAIAATLNGPWEIALDSAGTCLSLLTNQELFIYFPIPR
jgi:hypothetical protein